MPNVLAVMLVYSLNSLTHVWGSTLLTLTLAPLRISQSAIGIMTIASILVKINHFCFLTTYFSRKKLLDPHRVRKGQDSRLNF